MRPKIDWWLILPAILLVILGLTIIRSVFPSLAPFQLAFVAAAAVAFTLAALVDYRIFQALHLPIYIASLVFLITPLIFGSHTRGALRWLQFGQISIQPSELVKPFLLLSFVMLPTRWRIIAFIIPALIIFFQPDLGTTLVLTIGWLTVFLSNFSFRRIALFGLTIFVLAAPIFWFVLKPYQKDRLTTFLNPYADPLNRGYQVIQSVITVGSGQFWGRGLGQGTQSQLRFLPERHTDFIFASLSEELGFVGAGFALILFLVVMWRIYLLSQSATNLAVTLYALGTLAMLSFQIWVNVGMNLGLAPITGITLPFVSYGGSSLVSLGLTLGILTSMNRHSSPSSFQIK
ncbi:MAG: FtsW/RodA/SpoVE family cell cycle protein [Patescibacteria group bacterium]